MTVNRPDQFAEIALRAHPLHGEGVHEIPPVPISERHFSASLNKTSALVEASYEQKLESFNTQMSEIRKRFNKFLENFVPAGTYLRSRIEIKTFQFRYHTASDCDFSNVLNGKGDWEYISVPDFRGPTKEKGKWTGYYRTTFSMSKSRPEKRYFLVFKGVDYKATVYLNGKCLGSHEGFFSPFEFDVTYALQAENALIVEVHNDYPMLGVDGSKLDGDKVYAATGLGWNDPEYGWHHCPPGAGIYNDVYVEERAELFIQDIFVRPNIDEDLAEVWVDVMNTTSDIIYNFELHMQMMPRNFEGETIADLQCVVEYAGPGMNYYRYKIPLSDYRLWEPSHPFLYNIRTNLVRNHQIIDERDRHFGLRKFHMDEESSPKGSLYLNNRPVILRGTNEMGHLQQCVLQHDFDQLIDDILLAKLANMNFYRVTQRPVQEEIYDYFDMLGMMHQCDLPLFGYLRRNQFCEAVKQTAEMERLVRSHPSTIVVSLINEPSRTYKRAKGHRHLFRDELEAFFKAARQAIYIENPDRVVKNAEGDYEPPTAEGLPDFHCYTMWYTNHGVPIGKLHQGYLPPVKENWKVGCGEYGTEGLDNLSVMEKYYPQEWMPKYTDESWSPDKIVAAQTYAMHGDWYEEQETITDWIRKSQQHQALATKLMTDALRRRADVVVSSAIHLLIDAWPAGWMKALVGVDRIPKPAYFTYQKCLKPIRVNLRADRWKLYSGQTAEIEAWLLNDTNVTYRNCRVIITCRSDTLEFDSYEILSDMKQVMPTYAGTLHFRLPNVDYRTRVHLDASVVDERGHVMDTERLTLEVLNRPNAAHEPVVAMGTGAKHVCETLGILMTSDFNRKADMFIVSDHESYRFMKEPIEQRLFEGARVIFLRDDQQALEWEIAGQVISSNAMQELYFAALNRQDARLRNFEADDLSYCFNSQTMRIDYLADCYIVGENIQPLVFGYEKPNLSDNPSQKKRRLPLVGSLKFGDGEAVFVSLPYAGRIGVNPSLDHLLFNMICPSTVSVK